METFGEKIRHIRTEKNLSVREAAKRSGISHPYLSQLENGKRDIPTLQVIAKLATGLDTDLNFLLNIAGYSDVSTKEVKQFKNLINIFDKLREEAPEGYDLDEILLNISSGTTFTYNEEKNTNYESLVIAGVAAEISEYFINKEPRLTDEQTVEVGDDIIESLKILLKRM